MVFHYVQTYRLQNSITSMINYGINFCFNAVIWIGMVDGGRSVNLGTCMLVFSISLSSMICSVDTVLWRSGLTPNCWVLTGLVCSNVGLPVNDAEKRFERAQ